MVVGAIVALAAAILFAALPYTLALPTNGSPITTHTIAGCRMTSTSPASPQVSG